METSLNPIVSLRVERLCFAARADRPEALALSGESLKRSAACLEPQPTVLTTWLENKGYLFCLEEIINGCRFFQHASYASEAGVGIFLAAFGFTFGQKAAAGNSGCWSRPYTCSDR